MANNKKLHKEIYDKCIKNYKYNSNYNPDNEYGMDSVSEYYDVYGTRYPKADKMDYKGKTSREYKKR